MVLIAVLQVELFLFPLKGVRGTESKVTRFR